MATDFSLLDELEKQMEDLRHRNAKLHEIINRQDEEIAKLKKELSTKRKKPGPKGRSPAQEKKYKQFVECIEKGMESGEITEQVGIGIATYYRYLSEYRESHKYTK